VVAINKIWLGLIFLILSIQNVFASINSKAKFFINAYFQDGTGGDQVFDNSKKEEVDVIEPMLFVDYKIDADTSVNVHLVFDTWTAASDTKLDGNTGASGEGIKGQSRIGGRFGYAKDEKSWAWAGNLGFSSEYDYKSLNFSGSWEGRFAEDNFVLSLSPQLYLDQAKDFDFQTEKTSEFKGRVITALDISGSQLLTRSDIVSFGYTFINMNGKLNNISNSVKVLDNPYGNSFSRVEERLPNNRSRHAVSTKWVHGFTDEIASHLSYRYYTDDWEVQAHTAEVGIRLSFMDDDAFLMPTYRYYTQDKSKYYVKEVPTSKVLMTADSDLANFDAHRLGVHYEQIIGDKKISKFDLLDFSFTSGAYYYKRSNDLDYFLVQFGIGTEF
tara:strand:+ start:135768 stop:136922 length:1155 start_codon:yes stop_codon:yes gene_type:complete